MVTYWTRQKEATHRQLSADDSCTLYALGLRALLKKHLWEVEHNHATALALFSATQVPTSDVPVPDVALSSDEDSNCDSLSDYDD